MVIRLHLLQTEKKITQDGHHHVPPQNLDGSARDEVEGCEHITCVDQCVARWSVGGLEFHGQGSQAAFGGAFKSFAVLEECAVQV